MTTEFSWKAGISTAPQAPLAKGLPLLGSALDMMKDPLGFLVQEYKTLGPIFEVKAANRQFIVLAGPDANRFMSQHGDKFLSGRDSWTTFADEINSKYFMAALDGEVHSRQRKVLKKAYSRQYMMEHIPDTIQITKEHLAAWQAGSEFVVFPTMQRLIAEQIGMLLLGAGPGEYFGDFVIFMRTLLNAVMGQQPKFVLNLPQFRNAKKRVMDLAAQMIAEHRKATTNPEKSDLVDFLLDAQAEQPDIFAEPELLVGVLGPYLAGIDTAAGTCSFILYALLKHPDVIQRILPEVDAAFANGAPDANTIRNMDLLHAAIIESMRLYPVAPMLPRTVVEPFEFAGYSLQTRSSVMMANGVAHFDETLYTNPNKFDIDRILAPRQEHKQLGAFAPYGLGSHTCAGAGFAEVEILLTIASLLHNFELSMEPKNYVLKQTFNPAPAPSNKFKIRIVRRRN